MPVISGAILIEIVGQDVVACQMRYDERQEITLGFDTPNMAGLVVADLEGSVPVKTVTAGGKTSAQFTKRSAEFTWLYRRTGFVGLTDGEYQYRDSWRFDYQRLITMVFPQYAAFRYLNPAILKTALDSWQDRPVFQALERALVVEAAWQIDATAFAAAHLPHGTPPDMAAIAAQLPFSKPAMAETLRVHLAADPASAVILAGTAWMGPLLQPDGPPPATDSLWYFAYGGNMAEEILMRRGVKPTASHRATLDSYALRFNHGGMPPLEPVFANIEQAPGAQVHGVAHQITPAEAALFDGFEPGYQRIPVTLHLADGNTVEAFAYTSKAPVAPGVPSARYLNILLAGGRAHGLPAELLAEWESLLAHAPTATQTPPSAADLDQIRARRTDEHLPADLLNDWDDQRV